MPASYANHRAPSEALRTSGGMPPKVAERTAELMAWADLHGIDSHGISMIPGYFERMRAGRVNMRAQPSVARETPVSALVDGDGGLGHEPSRQAMELAIAKARGIGIGVVPVHNSPHFGACGRYPQLAAHARMSCQVAT